jgi:hypothetical protein
VRIALVSREYAVAKRSKIATLTRRAARGLIERGHEVRVITQAAADALGTEAQGRLIEHRVAVAREPALWGRTAMGFSVEAARILGELHARGEVDVVEFPDAEASGAAMLLLALRAGSRPPVVVTTYAGRSGASELESVERLCALGADATCRGDASVDDRLELYAILGRNTTPGARPGRPSEHRARRLDAWRSLRNDAARLARRKPALNDDDAAPPASPEKQR